MSELGKINKMNYNFAKEKDRSKVINPSAPRPRDIECVSQEAASSSAKRSPAAWAFTRSATPEQPCRQDLEVACFFFSFLF